MSGLCWCDQGSPFVSDDLIRAGVRHASSALVFKQSLCSVDNVALLDADMVCIYRCVVLGSLVVGYAPYIRE